MDNFNKLAQSPRRDSAGSKVKPSKEKPGPILKPVKEVVELEVKREKEKPKPTLKPVKDEGVLEVKPEKGKAEAILKPVKEEAVSAKSKTSKSVPTKKVVARATKKITPKKK